MAKKRDIEKAETFPIVAHADVTLALSPTYELPERPQALQAECTPEIVARVWAAIAEGKPLTDFHLRYMLAVTQDTLEAWVVKDEAFRAAYFAAIDSTRIRVWHMLEQGFVKPQAAIFAMGVLGVMPEDVKRGLAIREKDAKRGVSPLVEGIEFRFIEAVP